MDIYLPVAEMTVSLEVIVTLGASVGFLSTLFGVGGGFLATPFLIFLGVPASFAVGTQAVQLISTSLAATIHQARKGQVDFKMGSAMLCGSLVGTLCGILIFRLLQYTGHIDVTINILYILLLGSVGGLMAFESVKSVLHRRVTVEAARSKFWSRVTNGLPYVVYFPKSGLSMSLMAPIFIGFLGGLMVSIMGIGGGFVMVPAMIYILGMPGNLVNGTSMFQILITTTLSAFLHILSNNTVDLLLAFLLMLGSLLGAQIGVKVTKYVKGAWARLSLSLLLLSVCGMLWQSLFIEPKEHFKIEVAR